MILTQAANILTAVRLLLAPIVIWAILTRRHFLALALFFAAALTDIADGWLARHFGGVSRAGAYLDPVADKILLGGIYIALTVIGSVPLWLTVVIFGRDLLLLLASAAVLLFTSYRQLQPSAWGKLSTFVQIATALAFLTRNASGSPALDNMCRIFAWTALAATTWSAIHYTWRGWRMLNGPPSGRA